MAFQDSASRAGSTASGPHRAELVTDQGPSGARDVDERALFARIDRRVLPLPFLLGFISIIDRVNIGFTKESLSADLGLTATAFGFGAGVLFLGYVLLEIPSNVALRRFGARAWLCRIAVTWGIICSFTAFVPSPGWFYVARFLLGAAEAGLFPGVLLYLTFWYPARRRGRAVGIFMANTAVATVLGGPIAGLILLLDGAGGLTGWQWLFLVDGIPAILLGIALPIALSNSPARARWLTEPERTWLTAQISADENDDSQGHVRGHLGAVLRSPIVWAFAAVYFLYASGEYGMAFFLPSIIEGFGATSGLEVGLLTAVPYLIGTLAMILVARHADGTGERRFHLGIPLALAGLAMLGAGLTLSKPVVSYGFFLVVGASLMTSLGSFWARPTRLLAGTAAASGIALINSVGNVGGFAGPYAFGALIDAAGGSDVAGLALLSGTLLLGAVITLAIRAVAHDRDPGPGAPATPG